MQLALLPWMLADLIGATSRTLRASKSDFAALPLLVRTISALRRGRAYGAHIDIFCLCPKAPTSRQCGFHCPSLVVCRSWIESQSTISPSVWEHHHHAFCRDKLRPSQHVLMISTATPRLLPFGIL